MSETRGICDRRCKHNIKETYEHRGHRSLDYCEVTGKMFRDFETRPKDCPDSTTRGEDGKQN